ncbi:TetR/AcrR family transcriptional regulator [Virgibacillus halodenitrificans]|uniref:TetR/AcrR family transcriptional regulator n=1 Tax=Virgibacillus halodenitrificans TaxID=1482 RepID=UPI001FB28C16|nr:TetR/AcrR family transcriptional regulator [Virgibacillus halodenitrificans]
MGRSMKKEKILEVAERLFYEHGFRGVGLKQIIREANVATMTLYNHFSSKESLVQEVLKQREQRYWSYLDSHIEKNSDLPILLALEAHGEWLKHQSYKGDMFLRAMVDYAGFNSEIVTIVRTHKERLLQYFQELARQSVDGNADEMAYQFTLLIEGATSLTAVVGAAKATEHSLAIARKLTSNIN